MKPKEVIIISAMTESRVIGNEDASGMPWSVPEEYQRYVDTVRGHTVIMGYRSFMINGKYLDDVELIVLSRKHTIPGVKVCRNLEEAIKDARHKKVFIAGGGQIYAEALGLADKMLLSTIKGDFTGSVYFPEFNRANWLQTDLEDHEAYIYRVYEKKLNKSV